LGVYSYKARNRGGEVFQDKMEGSDTMSVAAALRQQGLLVIDIKEQGVGQKDILEPFKKVGLNDLVVFTRQFATMINAGLPIVRSLYVLSEQTDNKKLKETVEDVRKQVEAGLALSEALEKHPKVFSGCTWRWCGPGRSGASSTTCCCASPRNSKRTRTSGAR